MQKIAPDGLGVVVIHIDKKHIHAHCYRHSFNYTSLENTRVDNDSFIVVRQHVEKIQKERYPQLQTKIIYDNLDKGMKSKTTGKNRSQKNAIKLQERTNKILDKDLMSQAINDFFRIAKSAEHFFDLVKNHNIDLYTRGDKTIEDSKNNLSSKAFTGAWVNS